MKARIVPLVTAFLWLPLPAFAQQTAEKQQEKQEDPAAREREESRKRLAEIGKVLDDAKRTELLEKYVQENPKASNIDEAYTSLLRTLNKIDPPRAIKFADEILARPRDPDPKARLWKNAYSQKFLGLQNQIRELGRKILETESDPSVLQTAAGFDKENSLKLYEKAVAERQKDPKKDTHPTLSYLYSGYARKLSEQGRKDEAVKQMSRAIELGQAELAEAERLSQEDPKRRELEGQRQGVGSLYRELASLLADTGQPEKGLEALVKTDEALGSSPRAREVRPSIDEIRASIYANMGKTEEALESYTRAFAFRMSIATRDKIRELATKAGEPADEHFARARQLRQSSAEPFKPFDLKTAEGTPASLDSLKGKVTLVNFFFPT